MIRLCRCGQHEFETGNDWGWHSLQWSPDCQSPKAQKALAMREYMRTYMRNSRIRAERKKFNQ